MIYGVIFFEGHFSTRKEMIILFAQVEKKIDFHGKGMKRVTIFVNIKVVVAAQLVALQVFTKH